jgi:hypothetical protein
LEKWKKAIDKYSMRIEAETVNDTLPYALTQIANWKNDNSFNEEAHTLLRQVHFRKIFFERNVRGKCSRKASKKKNEV